MLTTKVYRPDETRILDEATGRVSAVVSSEKIDRDGDVIRADGWDLRSFKQHPVLLSSHDYHSLEKQIGVWEKMDVEGAKMKGVARFFIGKGNAEADWAFELAKEKQLAFSVGFIPDMEKAVPLNKDDSFGVNGMEFRGQELLEVSAVTVPSNPDALQRMVTTKGLHPVVAEIVKERLAEPISDDDLGPKKPRPLLVTLTDDQFDRLIRMPSQSAETRLAERVGSPEVEQDDEPSADDEKTDADDYGDGDEPEARIAAPELEQELADFDPYSVALQAAERAINEEADSNG
jgi:hypothetical protein